MRFKSIVAGLLSGAIVIGAPGLPCWQASAQMMVKGKVSGVPYKTGFVTGTHLPRSLKLDPFKSFTLTPSLNPTNLWVAPQLNAGAVIQNGLTLPVTVLPVSAIESVAAGPASEQVSATFFQTLQTLGAGLTTEIAKNGGAAVDEKLAESFDGSLGKKAADSVAETKAFGWGRATSGLKKRTALLAASSVLAVPAFSQTAQAAAEHPSWAGSVIPIALTVIGLSIFVTNMVVWARRLSKESQARKDLLKLRPAIDAASRLRDLLQTAGVLVPFVAAVPKSGGYELVAQFTDKAAFERAGLPAIFEGLSVRKELQAPGPIADLLKQQPKPGYKLNGWLAPLLTSGVLLASSAAAAKAQTVLLSAPTAADLGFSLLAFVLSLLFDRGVWVSLLVAILAGSGWPIMAILVFLWAGRSSRGK